MDAVLMEWLPPVALAQQGVFTRAQAFRAGMTRGQIQYRIKAGLWKPVAGKAFALADQRVGIEQGAYAAALTWPDAVVWGPSALRLWCPSAPIPRSEVILCAVPHPRQPQLRLVTKQTVLLPQERGMWGQVPCEAKLAALADTLAFLGDADADHLLAWAVTREEAPAEELAVIFARRAGSRGAATLRRQLPLVQAGAASAGELLAQAIFRRAGIKGWEPDARIDLPDGSFINVDFYFKIKHVIVEVDGYTYHGDKRSFQEDKDRNNRLAQTKKIVLRFTWEDLTQHEDYVVDTVKQVLR
jgi:hypothetical protein